MEEKSQGNAWTLLSGAIAAVALAALVALFAVRVFRAYAAEERVARGFGGASAEAAATRATQADRLTRYAWIDRQKGVVSIPIERAMTLVALEAGKEPAGGPR